MIKTDTLRFQYSKIGPSFDFPNVQLDDGENLLILGKSGVGKTTLLHLLAGLLKPTSGSVIINQTDITTLSSRKLDQFRGREIGLVFQKNHAIQSLNLIENLEARLLFSRKQKNDEFIASLLKELDLFNQKKQNPKQLSEGQLQRLGIAMAVVHQPKLILADEPTSSLDDINCNIVIDLLKQQAQKNKANLIVITHDQRIKPHFQNAVQL